MKIRIDARARARAAAAALACAALAAPAGAADGFKLRFPLSGTLGGEIVAPVKGGWFSSVAVTRVDVDKVTDDSGNQRLQAVAGTFATPTPVAGAIRTASYSGAVLYDAKITYTLVNLLAGYTSTDTYGGGRLTAAVNLPYAFNFNRKVTLSGTTPTLSTLAPALTTPPLPAGTAAAAQASSQAGFSAAYQASLAAQSAKATSEYNGAGDGEISAAWVYAQDGLKVVAGMTLVLPTGNYDATNPPNIGFGNYTTVRPGLGVAYQLASSLTLGARGSVGFNSRNKDNGVRSGDYGVLDLALAWRAPIGVFGPHFIKLQQFEDDDGGTLGPNRLLLTSAGVFFTTLIPGIEAGLNLSYMKVLKSANSLSGSFVQARLSKAF